MTSSDENVCSVYIYLKSNESHLKVWIHTTLKSFWILYIKIQTSALLPALLCVLCKADWYLIDSPPYSLVSYPPFLKKRMKKGWMTTFSNQWSGYAFTARCKDTLCCSRLAFSASWQHDKLWNIDICLKVRLGLLWIFVWRGFWKHCSERWW